MVLRNGQAAVVVVALVRQRRLGGGLVLKSDISGKEDGSVLSEGDRHCPKKRPVGLCRLSCQ